jgi:molecular chaperone Hsp33
MTMSAVLTGDNLLRPFQLERSALRGRLVRLGSTVDRVLTQHEYPEPISRQLGELLVLAATLAGALKFQGTFSLQIKSDGPISLMLADCTNDGELRGYAQFDETKLALATSDDVPGLFGHGHLALTVEQSAGGDSYQGIVELAGEELTDCMHAYFRQSEQVQTGLRIAVDRVDEFGGERWRAGGIMLQRLPGESLPGHDYSPTDEDWRRTMLLLSTATPAELVDPHLPLENLLLRLFHEEGVRVFRPLHLSFGCRCTRERVEALLRMFPEDELEDMKLEDGDLEVTCQFCNQSFHFDEAELAQLRDAKLH